jgi:putative transposase
MVFHVLNRGVDRKTLFHNDGDYRAFEEVLKEGVARHLIRLCAYCLMPNHWHLVLWPSRDRQLSCFMHHVTTTHAVRWKMRNDSAGEGHLYQNRFKSFPVQTDAHYLNVVQYVERNALRANLVERAEEWRFSSLWRRETREAASSSFLSTGPVHLPEDWVERVNRPEASGELEALRTSVRWGKPYGTKAWQKKTGRELDLGSSLCPRGRPRKS